MSDDHIDLRALIASLRGPADPELSCEQCFDQLDRYVEARLAGADLDRIAPGMLSHLRRCAACGEDHDALAAFVASDRLRRLMSLKRGRP